MKFVNVAELTKNAVAQTLGVEYMKKDGNIQPIESYNLIDVGKDVLDSGSVDAYVKSLLVQIGKMVIDSKEYVAELPSLFVDSFDWGGYVERVYFSPQDLIADDMYNLVDGNTYDDHKFYKPNATAKIFEEAKTITCPISITAEQMKMAFTSWEMMNKFLSGIYTNVRNTIVLGLEAYAHMLISAGYAVAHSATKNVRHLITEYYGTENKKTAVEAMKDKDFLIYVLSEIAIIKDNMRRYTSAFNNGSIPTFTSKNDCNVTLLGKLANAIKFNVKANTFDNESLGIGEYETISAWQAFKATDTPNFDYSTVSTISISADSNNKLGIGTDAVELTNCVGIIYDHRALGLCPHKSKVTSNYTAIADFWNEYHHELVNYILDANYNIVALALD